ncbi:MAG: integration host factor, actinobacterial type [Actinomycetota bacterium]|nr:integration host factor, actinobacterial type [Actinomycetota bacterium]
MSVPERTPDQRSAALAVALAARQERARLRERLKRREVTGLEVLEGAGTREEWAALRVTWLLESLPGIGAVRADRLLDALGIARSRRIRGLGERQRAALLAELARDGR